MGNLGPSCFQSWCSHIGPRNHEVCYLMSADIMKQSLNPRHLQPIKHESSPTKVLLRLCQSHELEIHLRYVISPTKKPPAFPNQKWNPTAKSQSSVPPTIWASAEGRNVINLQPSKNLMDAHHTGHHLKRTQRFFCFEPLRCFTRYCSKGWKEVGDERNLWTNYLWGAKNQQHGVQNPVCFIKQNGCNMGMGHPLACDKWWLTSNRNSSWTNCSNYPHKESKRVSQPAHLRVSRKVEKIKIKKPSKIIDMFEGQITHKA